MSDMLFTLFQSLYCLRAIVIYQAKQKLELIKHLNEQRTSSEELIKYAHKISASNAVAAPATWAPGK